MLRVFFFFTRGFARPQCTGPSRPKCGMMLSIEYITFQWVNVEKTNHAIHWMAIYPVGLCYLYFEQPLPHFYWFYLRRYCVQPWVCSWSVSFICRSVTFSLYSRTSSKWPTILSGHPLLSDQLWNSQNHCQLKAVTSFNRPPVQSSRGHLFASQGGFFCCLSPC